jgi:pimeloyl-ACP methyl ester carboxylesterase
MRWRRLLGIVVASSASLLVGCDRARDVEAATAPPPPIERQAPRSDGERVVVEKLEVPGDIPSFVLRGATGETPMVFLHGMCGHGQGYVQAFQGAAAEKGPTLALSGDDPCGGSADFRRWSMDLDRIDRRIAAAFQAAGIAPAGGIVLIGMSQGALRAEALAERFPDRYTHAIFMGSPRPPSAARVRRLRGAVVMSGELEGTWGMKQGALALQRAGVPATFIPIPGAQHAQLLEGEATMDRALDWLWAHSRSAPGPS